jgi:hypothetical protein
MVGVTYLRSYKISINITTYDEKKTAAIAI